MRKFSSYVSYLQAVDLIFIVDTGNYLATYV